MKSSLFAEWRRSNGANRKWTALAAAAAISCFPVSSVFADNQRHGGDGHGIGAPHMAGGVVMEVVADTQVGVVMEAAPRTWLAVETGAAADMEAARTLTPDKRTRAKGIPEVAIASPMPTAARIRIKQLDTRITRFPQIQEKASLNKTGQTARLNTGR